MAKYIKKIKEPKTSKPNIGLSISANISQKKIIKSIKKSISSLPLQNVSISINGTKNSNNHPILGTILIILGLITVGFGYLKYKQEPKIPQCILPEPNYVESQVIISTPKPINKKININILNATYKNGIALNLKKTLIQNKFEFVTIGNSKSKTNLTTIEYSPEYQIEAEYLLNNYSVLSNAILREVKISNSLNNIVINLGNYAN